MSSGVFLIFDSATGNITGRLFLHDIRNVDLYPHRLEIDAEEYNSQPEIYSRVDTATKKLADAPVADVAARLGRVPIEKAMEMINERKQRRGPNG